MSLRFTRAAACGVFLMLLGVQPALAFWPFDVDLTLSKRASYFPHNGRGGIVIDATYWGWPLPNKQLLAEHDGKIHIGNDSVGNANEGKNRVPGHVRLAPLGWTKTPMVTIHVHAARGDDLHCTGFEDTIAKAQSAYVRISCKVAGE